MTVSRLKDLYDPKCRRCPLYFDATHVCVPSSGKRLKYPAIIVGEAPGRQEDEQNEPFVGRSGWLLNRELKRVGIDRDSIVVTNAVKCRPEHNGTPSSIDVATCVSAFLLREIELVKANVCLALGNAAALALLVETGVTRLRGVWHAAPYHTARVRVTWHPAYVWRSGLDSETAVQFREDLAEFSKVLG